MSRQLELIAEVELAAKKMVEFAKEKINKIGEEQCKKESHLMGIDLLHDACHTLRGRLPKTEKVSLPAMKELWK